jgi:hypothetical protein
VGSDAYDPKRCPAWTDRVLWRDRAKAQRRPPGPAAVACVAYSCSWASRLSDHKPVYALLDVQVGVEVGGCSIQPSPLPQMSPDTCARGTRRAGVCSVWIYRLGRRHLSQCSWVSLVSYLALLLALALAWLRACCRVVQVCRLKTAGQPNNPAALARALNTQMSMDAPPPPPPRLIAPP